MRDVDTRTLQDLLRYYQIMLAKCTDEQMKEAYKGYIVELSTELLYRWREDTKHLVECHT